MVLRVAVALTAVFVAVPALAETMNADAARRFVAGKLFSFTCFEGSAGTGRIFNDGSVAGVVRMQGNGNTRFMHLPPGTLYPKDGGICSHVKGAFFNPCFNLTRTSEKSFRGQVSGFGFAYCDFVRRGGGRDMVASVASVAPSDAKPAPVRPSIRTTRRTQPAVHEPAAPSQPAAAPTQPVTSAPLPAVEQAGMRSSIAP